MSFHILPAEALSLPTIVACLQDGGIVIHPTETCYGIACDLENPSVIEKLFYLKQRPLCQPVSALYPSQEMAEDDLLFSSLARKLAQKYLPGPLTIVLPLQGKPRHNLHVTADGAAPMTIGMRISSHPFAQAMVQAFGKPIATTSANLHGRMNPYSAEEVQEQLGQSGYLLIDGGQLEQRAPSTVVQVMGETWKILRKGDCDLSSVLP